MRRTVLVSLAAVSVTVSLISDSFGVLSEPNATAPATVPSDQTMTVTIRECGSGVEPGGNEGFIDIWPPPKGWTGRIEVRPDDDGITEISGSFTYAGTKSFDIECGYEDNDEAGWREVVIVTVTPVLTKAERKRCKKIDNPQKRRKCLKKERAD